MFWLAAVQNEILVLASTVVVPNSTYSIRLSLNMGFSILNLLMVRGLKSTIESGWNLMSPLRRSPLRHVRISGRWPRVSLELQKNLRYGP